MRRSQIRLSYLFIGTALFAAVVGYFVYQTRKQEETVEAVESLGGNVRFDHEMQHSGVGKDGTPGPEWLREAIGDRYLVELKKIAFDQLTDSQLEQLVEYPLENVEHLILIGCDISDEGCVHLNSKVFPNLRKLWVDETAISDSGIEYLSKLESLEVLQASNTMVSDAGLQHFLQSKKLKVLAVENTAVTKEAASDLVVQLPGLRVRGDWN